MICILKATPLIGSVAKASVVVVAKRIDINALSEESDVTPSVPLLIT
jgi:hypothetical protein